MDDVPWLTFQHITTLMDTSCISITPTTMERGSDALCDIIGLTGTFPETSLSEYKKNNQSEDAGRVSLTYCYISFSGRLLKFVRLDCWLGLDSTSALLYVGRL